MVPHAGLPLPRGPVSVRGAGAPRSSIEGSDQANPDARARYAIDRQGRFFKGYSEDGGQTWHGWPVRRELVPRQFPARVLKEFVQRGLLAKSDYKKLLGSAS